jgi:squalene-associated FAD-dependent desaturase
MEDVGPRLMGATPRSERRKRVAVIGGGWSGLACAVRLVDAGCDVTVFEAADTLGGRARRITHRGIALDNGQHLLLGAYRQTLEMIDRVRPARISGPAYTRAPLCLAGPGAFRLQVARLPAPFHTLLGLLAADDCTWSERIGVVRAFIRWQRAGWRCAPHVTVSELLAGQPRRMTARLWAPVCLAALNTPPDSASAQVFLNVLRDGLAASSRDSDLVLAAVDLSQLFPEPAADYVAQRGGTVRTHAMVERIDAGAAIGIRVRGAAAASEARFDCVVIATAPWQASRLLEPISGTDPARTLIGAYRYLPICTIYVHATERVKLDEPMMQLPGAPGQWVFDRTPAAMQGSLLAIVISADGPHRHATHAGLVAAVIAQLRESELGVGDIDPAWSHVITEKRATFACLPARAHPSAGQVAPRVFLAGDHTDPDYPATLEAAVRSGLRAAEAAIAMH